jgi:hypothetical protein
LVASGTSYLNTGATNATYSTIHSYGIVTYSV